MLERIRTIVEKIHPSLIEIRRHFHRYPELSAKEYKTATYIAGILSSNGLKVREGVGKTGVVAELPGKGIDNRILAIRTDMDALPILEQTDLEYASRYSGVMHACGHDIHATVGVGTAIVLSQLDDEFPGKIRFLFQPAEEILKGALWMIEDKVVENVTAIIGVHVYPSIVAGTIGIRYGSLTAAADFLDIEIIGKTADSGSPHESVDAVLVASQIILAIQQAIRQINDPLKPVVVTIGTIEGGKGGNFVADRVKLSGTVRSLYPVTRAAIPEKLERVIRQICQIYGAEYEFDYRLGVPSVRNNQELTNLLETSSREALGDSQVQIIPDPSLGGEDFAHYLDYSPGTMFRLGVGYRDRKNYPLHHPKFEVNEEAIAAGVIALAHTAYNFWKL
ncbi:MAG: amidohydrolase [Oscillatoria sp. SIO1A7]|nr:amidohydrolase [Oscillatoria sp. SIO1A7]